MSSKCFHRSNSHKRVGCILRHDNHFSETQWRQLQLKKTFEMYRNIAFAQQWLRTLRCLFFQDVALKQLWTPRKLRAQGGQVNNVSPALTGSLKKVSGGVFRRSPPLGKSWCISPTRNSIFAHCGRMQNQTICPSKETYLKSWCALPRSMEEKIFYNHSQISLTTNRLWLQYASKFGKDHRFGRV